MPMYQNIDGFSTKANPLTCIFNFIHINTSRAKPAMFCVSIENPCMYRPLN